MGLRLEIGVLRNSGQQVTIQETTTALFHCGQALTDNETPEDADIDSVG